MCGVGQIIEREGGDIIWIKEKREEVYVVYDCVLHVVELFLTSN